MSLDVGVLLPRDLPAHQVLPYARRADALGFAELWVVEDLGFRGGMAQAAAALAVTERIRVGVGILPVGARNVAFAAMEAATVAELFPGRLHLGIGHGMPDWMRQAGAWPASPLTAFEEYVTALRALLRGEQVTVDGRYVRLDGVRLETPPSEVPTVLAGPVGPEYLAAAIAQIGHAPDHRVVAYEVAAVDADASAARDRVRPALAWVGDPGWAPHIDPMDFAAEFRDLRDRTPDRAEFAAALPDAWVDRLAVVGTPEQARARLDGLALAGADAVVLAPAGPDPLAALEGLAAVL